MMRSLDSMGLRAALKERIAAKVPFLGICLGMQALFEASEEAPGLAGSGDISGARGSGSPRRLVCRTWDGTRLLRKNLRDCCAG